MDEGLTETQEASRLAAEVAFADPETRALLEAGMQRTLSSEPVPDTCGNCGETDFARALARCPCPDPNCATGGWVCERCARSIHRNLAVRDKESSTDG